MQWRKYLTCILSETLLNLSLSFSTIIQILYRNIIYHNSDESISSIKAAHF